MRSQKMFFLLLFFPLASIAQDHHFEATHARELPKTISQATTPSAGKATVKLLSGVTTLDANDCCEISATFGGEGHKGYNENHSGENSARSPGAGSIERHSPEGNNNARNGNGGAGGAGGAPGNLPAGGAPSGLAPGARTDPHPPLISKQQIHDMAMQTPPSKISVDGMRDLQAMLKAATQIAGVMTGALLKDLLTTDPAEAIKAMVAIIAGGKLDEIVKNLKNLKSATNDQIISHATTTSEQLSDELKKTTDPVAREVLFRDRDMWENIIKSANDAKASPATLKALGLPYLKHAPNIRILLVEDTWESRDDFFIRIIGDENTYGNASFANVEVLLIEQSSASANFKKFERNDTTRLRFQTKESVFWTHPIWIMDNLSFGIKNEDRFGKFYFRTKVVYRMNQMYMGESKWATLHYEAGKSKFIQNRFDRAIPFGAR